MSLRLDPLAAFRFRIVLMDAESLVSNAVSLATGAAVGGFSEARGLESALETETYFEGGLNDRVHRFPSRMSYSNITLLRGVTLSEDLWAWHEGFQKGEGQRRDGLIVLQDGDELPVKTWSFSQGLPVRWTGPLLKAGESALAVEALEIAHEKLELLVSPGQALAKLSPF